MGILFFGCRRRESDYLYRDELEGALGPDGCLSELHLAFSREGPEKVYVQHKIKEQGAKLWPLIDKQKARIFVCGATSMGKSVRAEFLEIIKTHGGMGQEAAERRLDKMFTTGQYY